MKIKAIQIILIYIEIFLIIFSLFNYIKSNYLITPKKLHRFFQTLRAICKQKH